jgi:diguanylate cyclase (GGDEF)-like protein
VTASIGIATLGPDDTLERLVARADEAMYAAKQGGRNRVEAARAAAPPSVK